MFPWARATLLPEYGFAERGVGDLALRGVSAFAALPAASLAAGAPCFRPEVDRTSAAFDLAANGTDESLGLPRASSSTDAAVGAATNVEVEVASSASVGAALGTASIAFVGGLGVHFWHDFGATKQIFLWQQQTPLSRQLGSCFAPAGRDHALR